jgi:hypothetical protein
MHIASLMVLHDLLGGVLVDLAVKVFKGRR